MRAGPLSSPEVIDLLNGAFVPVFAVNEDYRDDGPAPAEEKAEYRRIYREALEAKLSAGLGPRLRRRSRRPPDRFAARRRRGPARSARRDARARDAAAEADEGPDAGPAALALRAPPAAPGSLVLHLTARGHGNSWDGFPSEDWIVLAPEQVKGLLPVD